MGPPPEGALNLAAWNMIRDLVGADPALNQAAWESLRGVAGLLPSGEPKASRAALPPEATSSFDQPLRLILHRTRVTINIASPFDVETTPTPSQA